jgi:hypothetical protein
MHLIGTHLVLALLGATAAAQQPLDVAGVPADAPFTVWASATPESLTLDVEMKPGWHMYARDVGGGQPVSVTMGPRSNFVAGGKLVVPQGEDGKLTDSFRLVQPLKKRGGGNALAARFEFADVRPHLGGVADVEGAARRRQGRRAEQAPRGVAEA